MNNFNQGQMQPRAQFSSPYFNSTTGVSTPMNKMNGPSMPAPAIK